MKEIDDLAKFLAKRAAAPVKQPDRPDGKVTAVRNPALENLVLLGDFNIVNREDVTMKSPSKPDAPYQRSCKKFPVPTKARIGTTTKSPL